MQILNLTQHRTAGHNGRYFGNTLSALCLLLLLACAGFGQENAARRVQQDASAPQPTVANPFSDNVAPIIVRPPAEIARTTRTVYVRSKTLHVPAATFENELRKRQEFQALGLIITRDPSEADLWIEVDRNLFTRTFVLTAVDPKSNTLVISARKKAYLIIGDRIAAKLAKSFIRQMREARAARP
jgi:hypothetical protein